MPSPKLQTVAANVLDVTDELVNVTTLLAVEVVKLAVQVPMLVGLQLNVKLLTALGLVGI